MIVTLTVAPLAFPLAAPGDVEVGEVITKANADKVTGLVSEGVQWCVKRGMNMTIVPYEAAWRAGSRSRR